MLPYFVEKNDSLRVFQILYELNNCYSDIFDTRTQLEYFELARRYAPDSLPLLRTIMDFNIITTERRDMSMRETYKRHLDSLRSHGDKDMMTTVAPVPVMMYSDLYRLGGEDRYLDSAAKYMNEYIPADIAAIYETQRLSQSVSRGDKENANKYYAELEQTIASGVNADGETMRTLRTYYAFAGDGNKLKEIERQLDSVQIAEAASEKVNALAYAKSDMQRNRLHSVMRQEKEKERKQIWLIVGVIVAATAIACAYILMRMKKHQRRSEDNLNRELDKTRRQLTVERLRDVEKSGSDAEWEKFEAVFVKMHPNFSDTLK